MIMCLGANSHFALLLPPGLTSQCISSIMQRHWDPFRCVPRRAALCEHDPQWLCSPVCAAVRPRSQLQPGMPAWPACSSQGMVVRLPRIQGSSGVIISRSPRVTPTGSAAVRGKHGLNTDRMEERRTEGKGAGLGEGGVGSSNRGRSAAPRLSHMSQAGWAWGPRDILEIFTCTQWTWLQN